MYHLFNLNFEAEDHIFTDDQHNSVQILHNRLYSVATMHVNYTTYDVCREQDIVNPHTYNNVMVLSYETKHGHHPYWFAHVLQVFRAHVCHCGAESHNLLVQPMEILWVHWYEIVPGHHYRSTCTRLLKISFVPDSDLAAFGFLDPSLVIRGCHLIPVFSDGHSSNLLRVGHSLGRCYA